MNFSPFVLLYFTTLTTFREMNMFQGRGYIGRIKANDAHDADDELYAIVYKGNDTVDYNHFKAICCIHNNKFFYTKKVNESNKFTMEECVMEMNNHQMCGGNGL